MTSHQEQLAEAIRQACIDAAINGYEEAGMAGLCAEGQVEMTIDAMRSLDLRPVLREWDRGAVE